MLCIFLSRGTTNYNKLFLKRLNVHLLSVLNCLSVYSYWGRTKKDQPRHIGGLHFRHVGVQNKRKFVHIVCINFNGSELPEEKNHIVPVHQHGRHDVTCKSETARVCLASLVLTKRNVPQRENV